jgi:hypothetical protein
MTLKAICNDMKLKILVNHLNEVSQGQKVKGQMFSLICGI